MSPLLLIHISGATIALFAGAMAVVFRKGSGWHAVSGNVFFVSMIAMTTSAAYIASTSRPNRLNFEVAVLTCYLVVTAWVAARRREGKTGLFDWAALLLVLADGVAGLTWGFMAVARGRLDHMPAAPFFIFGAVALWCASNDIRMLARGGVTGPRRVARHLWRMCLALLITGLSLYPGQAKLFSPALRNTNLLIAPQIMLIGFMLISLIRVTRAYRVRRSAPRQSSAITSQVMAPQSRPV